MFYCRFDPYFLSRAFAGSHSRSYLRAGPYIDPLITSVCSVFDFTKPTPPFRSKGPTLRFFWFTTTEWAYI